MQNENKEYQVATAYAQYNKPNFATLQSAKEYTKQLRNKGIEFVLWDLSDGNNKIIESWN